MTLGGRIDPINNDLSCRFGLATQGWPSLGPENPIYAIPMGYVEAIQRQETWDNLRTYDPDEVKRVLFVPQTGPRTLKLPYVTTLSSAEVQRVEQEERDEILRREEEGRIVVEKILERAIPKDLTPAQQRKVNMATEGVAKKIMKLYSHPDQVPEAPRFKSPLDAGRYPLNLPPFIAPSPLEHFNVRAEELQEQLEQKHIAEKAEYIRKLASGEISPETSESGSSGSGSPELGSSSSSSGGPPQTQQ